MADINAEILKLADKRIKDLLKTHGGATAVTAYLSAPANLDTEATALKDELMQKLDTEDPVLISNHIARGTLMAYELRVKEIFKRVLFKRVADHKKIDNFKRWMSASKGRVYLDYRHLSKQEKDQIFNEKLEKKKKEAIEKDEITEELYQRIVKEEEKKRLKESEKKRDSELKKKMDEAKFYVARTGQDPYFKPGLESRVKIGSKVERDKKWHGPIEVFKRNQEMNAAWWKWYDQEMENLRAAYNKEDISPEEFEKNKKALNKFLYKKTGLGVPERFVRGIGKGDKTKYGKHLVQVSQMIALTAIGAIVSATTGSWYFFIAFLSISLYFLVPNPNDYEPKKGKKITMMTWLPVGSESRSQHNSYAFLRSLAKVSAIIFFAYAFKGLGDVFNIFYIGIAIFGYFLLKVDYNPDVPAEFIESVFRFFIGIFFIPTIFVTIFDSWVLGAIALAFFAVPPLPAAENKNIASVLSRGLSGATAYYELADKFVFGGLMLFALIGSGSVPGLDLGTTWQLSGALQNTFIYFWIVTGVAGFFSPAKERPVTGAIMLGAATIIYGIGPGSQIVGSGLLGDWWPTVHNTFTDVTEPLANVMDSLGKTFGQGFMLLTNPVGYATQLMNGSYTSSGPGPVGSYGVDITSLSVSPVYPAQPFVVTAILENKGAFGAENVKMSLQALSSDKYGTEGKSRTTDILNLDLIRETDKFELEDLGFSEGCKEKDALKAGEKLTMCTQTYPGTEFSKMLVWQAAFQSTKGVSCNTISRFDIRKKYIPIYVTSTYDYQSDSRVQVEFISKAEWDRKAQAGELDRGFRVIESQYSSAPVKFPIGTAGLKNPILETQQFHISMSLASAFDRDSQIDDVEKVSLTFPKEWEFATTGKCTPPPTDGGSAGDDLEYVEWTSLTGGPKTFVCYFNPLTEDKNKDGNVGADESVLGGSPTKTYIVTAHADYTFSRWKIKDTMIEFGGYCCPDKPSTDGCKATGTDGNTFWDKVKAYSEGGVCGSKDCLTGQVCVNNACVYSTGSGSEGLTATIDKTEVNEGEKAIVTLKGPTIGKVEGRSLLDHIECTDNDCPEFILNDYEQKTEKTAAEVNIETIVPAMNPNIRRALLKFRYRIGNVESNEVSVIVNKKGVVAPEYSFGGAKYCEWKNKPIADGGAGTKCYNGDGGCDSSDQCYSQIGSHPEYGLIVCKPTSIGVNICCFNMEPDDSCIAKYYQILNG